jgi:hypothetical protein
MNSGRNPLDKTQKTSGLKGNLFVTSIIINTSN